MTVNRNQADPSFEAYCGRTGATRTMTGGHSYIVSDIVSVNT